VSFSLYAETSKLIPLFLQGAEIYLGQVGPKTAHIYRKDLLLILNVFEKHQVSKPRLKKILQLAGSKEWPLPQDRAILGLAKKSLSPLPKLALHAVKFKVSEESDDVYNDDIYMYFFVTDGVFPSGKVTSIYKNLDEGDSFFFNQIDRVIYPAAGVSHMPQSTLIIDYGIMESDGDDIRESQALSGAIIDLAIGVYSAVEPESSIKLEQLRSEVKALSNLVLNMNDDDRLVTDTLVFQGDEMKRMLENQNYVEFDRKYKKSSTFDDFKYQIFFRMIRDDSSFMVTQ
jgi:basic membrane lipoprotein Med (substrate-binding protein (PBP1-ABC) superfamily)